MRLLLTAAIVTLVAALFCVDEASACGRRHRARYCSPAPVCCPTIELLPSEPHAFYGVGAPLPATGCSCNAGGAIPCSVSCPNTSGCYAYVQNGVCHSGCVDAQAAVAPHAFDVTKPFTYSLHAVPLSAVENLFGFSTRKKRVKNTSLTKKITMGSADAANNVDMLISTLANDLEDLP